MSFLSGDDCHPERRRRIMRNNKLRDSSTQSIQSLSTTFWTGYINAIQSVELFKGGFPAKYGGINGGIGLFVSISGEKIFTKIIE